MVERSLLRGAFPGRHGAPAPWAGAADRVAELRRTDLDLPLPGCGATAARWSALAGWGRSDLPFARLAEGHTDALAILAEAGRTPVPGALYGVWAARSGGTGADLVAVPGGRCALRGTVRFCSGARHLDRALVVAAAPPGARIVDVGLDDPRIVRDAASWQARGMRDSDSIDVTFQDLPVDAAAVVGPPGFYTGRPGFWMGGAGVAAVWLGGAAGVLDDLCAVLRDADPDPHRRAQLGALHTALAAADALLARSAAEFDEQRGADRPAAAGGDHRTSTAPAHLTAAVADHGTAATADHRTAAATARACVEHLCRTVLDVAPRLAGVAALCRNAGLEQRLADLTVYIGQHHGERDLAELGARLLAADVPAGEPTVHDLAAETGR